MDEWLVLCRVAHYGAAILIFGASLFQCALAPRDLGQALAPLIAALLRPAIALAVGTAFVWLILAAGQMGEGWRDALDPRASTAVLFDTAFGRVWQVHLLLGLLLLGLPAIGPTKDRFTATAILGALFLANLGFVGHAVMLAGPLGWISRASQAIHLLAAGIWLGALIPLVRCLGWLDHPNLRASALTALKRFSALGHGAVAVVLLTGAINTVLVLGTRPLDPSSPYQALLLAKVGVVALMVGIAIFNRYELVPKLGTRPNALRHLGRATIVEIVLGAVAVGLVGVLGTLAPT